MFASSFSQSRKRFLPKALHLSWDTVPCCVTLYHVFDWTCRGTAPTGYSNRLAVGDSHFLFSVGLLRMMNSNLEKRTPKQVSFLEVYKCHRRHGVQGSAKVLELQDLMCSLFSMRFFSDTAFRPSVTLHWLGPLIDIPWGHYNLFSQRSDLGVSLIPHERRKRTSKSELVSRFYQCDGSHMCFCRGKATCESAKLKAQSRFSQLFQNSDEMMSMTPLRVLRAAPRRRRWGDIGGEVGDVWRFAFFVFRFSWCFGDLKMWLTDWPWRGAKCWPTWGTFWVQSAALQPRLSQRMNDLILQQMWF